MNLFEHLQVVEDPRSHRTRRHDLSSILILALCATVAGADNWAEVAEFCRSRQQWFACLDVPAFGRALA